MVIKRNVIKKKTNQSRNSLGSKKKFMSKKVFTNEKKYYLSSLIKHPDPTRRRFAVKELTNFGSKASNIYVKFLLDKNVNVRIEAVKAIEKYGDVKAVPLLEKIIKTEKGLIHNLAIKALIKAKQRSVL